MDNTIPNNTVPANEKHDLAQSAGALRFAELPLIFAGIAVLGGLVSISGWVLDLPLLADLDGDGIAIQPNPSVAVAIAGIAVILHYYGFRTVVIVSGSVVALLGVLTLSQHLFGIDLGIDSPLTLGREWGASGTTAPGRMGPFASTCSLLVGVSLVVMALFPASRSNDGGIRRAIPMMCLGVIAITGFSIIAYLTGAKNFYAIPSLTAIALQTAIFFQCLGLSVLLSVRDLNPARLMLEDSATGRIARRLVPAVAVLPPLVMLVRIMGERAGFYDIGTGRALLILTLIFLMVAIQWRALKVIARYEREQRRANDELAAAHLVLEQKVEHRTEELREANAQLLDAKESSIREQEDRIGLLRRIVNTQEAERRRIGRDLHDELGQKLTGFRLALATLEPLVYDRPEVAYAIANLRKQSLEMDKEVSFLAWELRPDVLEHYGLAGSIRSFVEAWSKHHPCDANFQAVNFPDERLDPEIEMNFYRIVQEALNNVAKHADASSVSVILEERSGEIRLIVEDDGGGFEAEPTPIPAAPGSGLGLAGMRERVDLMGGTLEIESARGRGTTIYVRAPLHAARHAVN